MLSSLPRLTHHLSSCVLMQSTRIIIQFQNIKLYYRIFIIIIIIYLSNIFEEMTQYTDYSTFMQESISDALRTNPIVFNTQVVAGILCSCIVYNQSIPVLKWKTFLVTLIQLCIFKQQLKVSGMWTVPPPLYVDVVGCVAWKTNSLSTVKFHSSICTQLITTSTLS